MASEEIMREAIHSILGSEEPVRMITLKDLVKVTNVSSLTLKKHLRVMEGIEMREVRGYIIIKR